MLYFSIPLYLLNLLNSSFVKAAYTPNQLANMLYGRLTGTPPSSAQLDSILPFVRQHDFATAAQTVIQDQNFYDIRLKNWFKTFTNVDSNIRVPLNDFVATAIGIIRDNRSFQEVLTTDDLYKFAISHPDLLALQIPEYNPADNNHYDTAERKNVTMSNPNYLIPVKQSTLTPVKKDNAGVITTRAFAAAYFSAGTNRRATQYLFRNFLCHDFPEIMDTNAPDNRVRQDVDRGPGGVSATYLNKCKGCHAGQDGLGGAFAYFNFDNNAIVHTASLDQPPANLVQAKFLQNANVTPFELGSFRTVNNSWINYWAKGLNASFGWKPPTSGSGVNQLGTMIVNSEEFSRCMAKRVYQVICIREQLIDDDLEIIKRLTQNFVDSNYSIKKLFISTSAECFNIIEKDS